MKKQIIVGWVLLAVASTFGFVIQDDPLKKILTQLEKYRSDYFQEKVHLHLDKPYYAIGDNIWFKAYVVGAESHRLSVFSQFLYVDLINEKDSIKKSLKLPLVEGMAWGDFTLSDSLSEGNYRVRAYTSWMRNFGEDFFFDKVIRVGNSISNDIITNTTYTYTTTGKNQNVKADIKYTDLKGQPIRNKEVSYNIQLNFRSIAKGKGLTDEQGLLKLSFINSQPFILKSGKIYTSLKLDKKVVSKVIPVKATSEQTDLQFFPESGNLVDGIPSRVAFKAVGADGIGVPVSGYITDQDGRRISEFKSEHAGMGTFKLVPQKGSRYKAVIRLGDNSEKSFPLPKSLPEGYVLSINNTDSAILDIKVSVSPGIQKGGEIKLIAESNGVVYYASKSAISKNVFGASIDKSRFPTGIVHFSLFSPRDEAVAERLVFINHADGLAIRVNTEKPETTKREKVSLNLNAKDSVGKPVVGSFSLAVVDESKVQLNEESEHTILSNLLLTSDLKGYIERPNYYFTNPDDTKARHLDALMLTQGWRRFVWKNILANSFPAIIYPPEKTIKVSGVVTSSNGKPVEGGKVTLFSATGDVYIMDTVTNKEGRFVFSNLLFDDSTKFVIQARNQKNRRNVEIELEEIPPQLVTKSKNNPDLETNVNWSLVEYLANSREQFEEIRRYSAASRSILLSEVKIIEKKALVQNSSNLNGAGRADNVITAKELEFTTDLPTYLQSRVAGIVIRNGIAYSVRSMNSSISGLVPMQLVIDGMFVSPEFLRSVNPRDVESIEILKSAANTAIYGLRGGGGVMIINTKRGERNMGYRSYSPGVISYKPQGIYKAREFYSPNYDDPKTNQKIRDLRTTIFWAPNVITDTSGNATVTYFNADTPGSYAVIIEGIDVNGHIGRTVYRYKVN